MTVTICPLADDDLDAVLALLRPSEERSTFLVGNAIESGISDRGGPRNGLWLGAFEGGRLAGVVAHARGPDSFLVAPGGHARALLAEAERRGVRPRMILGTEDRVAEALAFLPASWRLARRNRETLMVLRWDRRVSAPPPRRAAEVIPLPPEHVGAVAAMLDELARVGSLPHTPEENRGRAARMAAQQSAVVALVDGKAVSMSVRAAATGRFVHVGATVTDPAFRRAGLAGACVDLVLDRARADGVASEGAVLFTGESNTPAIALYESLGFRPETRFDICVIEK